jgi:hypothetical protein
MRSLLGSLVHRLNQKHKAAGKERFGTWFSGGYQSRLLSAEDSALAFRDPESPCASPSATSRTMALMPASPTRLPMTLSPASATPKPPASRSSARKKPNASASCLSVSTRSPT